MKIGTLRPGLLVSLNTSIRGNVSYQRRDIEAEHVAEDGALKSAWETYRTVSVPDEHEEAIKVRSKARSLITSVCAHSSFGLLCPQSKKDELAEAVTEARRLADEFNMGSQLSWVTVHVIAGRIAEDDVEAVRAINSEIRGLLETMELGLQGLDVKAVREAATKARDLSAMLSTDAQSRVKNAIDLARSVAKQIVKAGEEVSIEIDAQTLNSLRESRLAFLDLDVGEEAQAPVDTGRAVDFEAASDVVVPMAAAPAIEF